MYPNTGLFRLHPLAPLCVALAAGVHFGRPLAAVAGVCGLACAFGLALLVAALLPRRPLLQTWAILLAALLLGSALMALADRRVSVALPPGPVSWQGVVSGEPVERGRTLRFDATLTSGPLCGHTVRVSLLKDTASCHYRSLRVGVGFEATSRLEAPANFGASNFDYATYLRRHGISGQAFCPAHAWQLLPESVADTLRSTLPLFTRLRLAALSLRDRLVSQYVDHVAGSGRGVVTALTLGDTSEIDRPTRDTYSQTGASHVLSLSGLHLSILFGVVKLLLLDRCSRRTTRTASHLLAIAGLWAFALLAGLPVSLVRSTAMYSILCLAEMSQRPNASFNSLATAAFFILLCAPMALFDVSFQLSFLSVAAILLILPLLTPKPGTWLTRFFTSFVTLPVVAQIVVAPLVALYFQTIPLYFLVANLVAVPASTAILILAIPFFIVPADSAQDCIGQVMGWAAETMNAAMNAIASWPYAYVTFRPSTAGVVMAYATIVAATLWLVRRRRADAYLFIGCTTLTACTELVMHSPLVIK